VSLSYIADFNEERLAYKLDKEGPHIFFEDNQVVVNYIRSGKIKVFTMNKCSTL
jgi:UDP-galactopyranose mutase